MIQQLVVNGCSYMYTYAVGQGHVDLAARLGVPLSSSLAIGGSANSRILRTTVKHSYLTDIPTLYVLGMTFISRSELPILDNIDEFEGRWTNPQNQEYSSHWQHDWTEKDVEQFVNLKLKSEVYSISDRLEDLMYRMLSVINDLKSRGHKVLIFQTGDNLYQHYLNQAKFNLLKQPEIIDGFCWRSIAWQNNIGVPARPLVKTAHRVPDDMRHPEPGAHNQLNEFLSNYITEHNIR
jgi:hypothetical protein